MVTHHDDCWGYHTGDISCEDVIRYREQASKNPYYCKGQTRSGYHMFDESSDTCVYEGCDQSEEELRGR